MSDSNMLRRGGIVAGTAGHIDHGKTALVRALTGMETDRLAEEKRRGISIDLGFAHLELPNGRGISFIDVPGHERFIRNMLAGAAGIEAVLLIVAADESVKPQTREHFEICRVLGIRHGLIVLTKCDLVSEIQIVHTERAVRELTAGSFLEKAPIVPVSATKGTGMDRLREALCALSDCATRREIDGFARLPLDRSFSLRGFGTVVTGTLWSGSLKTGDNVTILPSGNRARVRGIQVNGFSVVEAFAGARTALNLSGVDAAELQRGLTLISPEGLECSKRLHVQLETIAGEDMTDGQEVLLHLGTAETVARIAKLSQDSGGFAQLSLREPLLALPGDRFVVRRPSPAKTVGGGIIIDAFPPRGRRDKSAGRLATLERASVTERIEFLVKEKQNGRTLADLARLTGLTVESLKGIVKQCSGVLLVEGSQRVISREWIAATRKGIVSRLEKFHAAHPAAVGAPLADIRGGLDTDTVPAVLNHFNEIRVSGDIVALATHRPRVSEREASALAGLEKTFHDAWFQPPPLAQIPRHSLEQLIKSGRLVRISADLVFHADAMRELRELLARQKGRRFLVPEFKEWAHISRKYAIPLLEFFDRQHVTRRDGDYRIVVL